jgi:hypothetical protein
MKPLKFFKDRIGKLIFRNDSGCACQKCRDVVKNGLVVQSEDHAEYLYWTQNEFANDGCELNYRDTL